MRAFLNNYIEGFNQSHELDQNEFMSDFINWSWSIIWFFREKGQFVDEFFDIVIIVFFKWIRILHSLLT